MKRLLNRRLKVDGEGVWRCGREEPRYEGFVRPFQPTFIRLTKSFPTEGWISCFLLPLVVFYHLPLPIFDWSLLLFGLMNLWFGEVKEEDERRQPMRTKNESQPTASRHSSSTLDHESSPSVNRCWEVTRDSSSTTKLLMKAWRSWLAGLSVEDQLNPDRQPSWQIISFPSLWSSTTRFHNLIITNRRLHETWKRRKGKDMIWRLMVRG